MSGHRIPWDVERIRKDFPILDRKIYGKPLVYLDNTATTQKPQAVLQALQDYYRRTNANIHRGVYRMAEEARCERASRADEVDCDAREWREERVGADLGGDEQGDRVRQVLARYEVRDERLARRRVDGFDRGGDKDKSERRGQRDPVGDDQPGENGIGHERR